MQNWWPLPASQYDPDLGWVCAVLNEAGAELVEFRMRGQTIPIDQFKVSPPYIRFVNFPEGGITDAKAAVSLQKKKHTTIDTAIVVAVIGLLGVLVTASVNYLNSNQARQQPAPSEVPGYPPIEVPASRVVVKPSIEEPRQSPPKTSERSGVRQKLKIDRESSDSSALKQLTTESSAEFTHPSLSQDELEIKVMEDSWIEVRQAGKPVLLSRMIKGGTTETLNINEPFTLIVGKPDAVSVTFRGQPILLKRVVGTSISRVLIE